MDGLGAGLGRAIPDHCAHTNQRRLGRLRLRGQNGLLNGDQIVAVVHHLHVPVVGLKALGNVLGVAQVGGAVERDQVVVIQHNQLAQAQRSGQRRSLMANAFHQIAVTAQHIGVVVHRRIAGVLRIALMVIAGVVVDGSQVLLRHSDAAGHRKSLTERPGSYFHARRLAVLRMPRRMRSPLPELLELLHRQVIARQVQHTVEQRGGVTIGQDKAITVRPQRIGRVVLHDLVVQQVRDGRATQRCAGVAGLGLLDLVHGQKSQSVDRQLVECILLLLIGHCCPQSGFARAGFAAA